MKKVIWISIASLAVGSIVLVIVLLSTVSGQFAVMSMLVPDAPFNASHMGEPVDYGRERNWAALPTRDDEADLVPEGVSFRDNQGKAPADVFFIHGTGFGSRQRWTSPIDLSSRTAENTSFALANEASIFNSCCDVYAPRYRQASIFAYLTGAADKRDEILSAVYGDVEAAFDYFLMSYNRGRPFLIASHSQGSHHALRLISERIDGTPLSERLVVAYTIGSMMIPVSASYLGGLSTIHVCQNPEDTQCIVHWDTFGRNGDERLFPVTTPSLCVNPLTWETSEQLFDRSHHLGAVPIVGDFRMAMFGNDRADGVRFGEMKAPMAEYTWAQCESGTLYVEDQSDQKYSELGQSPDNSYHGVDLTMFHMNIRENSVRRVRSFLRR